MKKKNLELLLQKVPIFDTPDPSLEQYNTPANIASDIIFTAYLAWNSTPSDKCCPAFRRLKFDITHLI